MTHRLPCLAAAALFALTVAACDGGSGAADVGADADTTDSTAADVALAADGTATDRSAADASTTAADAATATGAGPDTSVPEEDMAEEDVVEVSQVPVDPPAVVIGTWNLLRFSKYGTDEFRIADIAEEIASLGVDILGVQEIMVAEGSDGTGPQAWDMLLDALGDGWAGVLTPWNLIDTNVGMLYRTDVVTVIASKPIFVGDWWEFPRAPLEATLRVQRDDRQITFKMAVLHLKAFGDSVDRRILACEALDQHIRAQLDPLYVVVGDYNDDPFDEPEENAFQSSFLADSEQYEFITTQLPETTVSSTGHYHFVDDEFISGEFLDHVVATTTLTAGWSSVVAEVHALPADDWDWWQDTRSDHFPVTVTLTP